MKNVILFQRKAQKIMRKVPDTFYDGSVTGVNESVGVICVVGVQQFEGQTKAFSFRSYLSYS